MLSTKINTTPGDVSGGQCRTTEVRTQVKPKVRFEKELQQKTVITNASTIFLRDSVYDLVASCVATNGVALSFQ